MMEKIDIAVKCQQVVKTYRTGDHVVMALNKSDFVVNTGELVILAGPSGCGKTTLISVVAGILDYDGGDCTVFGRNLAKLTEPERLLFRSKYIGFVFQQYNLIPTLTVAENVGVPLIINGVSVKEATAKAIDVLDQVGLSDRAHYAPNQLSGGQQQRVAIARAIVHDPHLIVCDEPTSALDGINGRNIMMILKKLTIQNNRTLIVVTHDNRIFDFADRIAEMEDGHVKHSGNS
ncbi:MAG: ABC transporter ATP-binding protein [Alphaproteobacteria bacterium]|nr:ABC transporter ATP-binding protein [Alphaproteobacteria bacterium]